MAFVRDSIQFRTGTTTPLSTFAVNINKVRTLILASGMLPVSEADWPGQMGSVVAGEATGNDVSLSAITYASTTTYTLGFWVFKHPTRNLYVYLRVRLPTSSGSSAHPQVPVFEFEIGHDINLGLGGFVGDSLWQLSLPAWEGSAISNSTYLRTGTFTMWAYCGKNGFWLYANGGRYVYASNDNVVYPLWNNDQVVSLLTCVAICNDAGDKWCSLHLPHHQSHSSYLLLHRFQATTKTGVRPLVNPNGVWTEMEPGALGDVVAPMFLITDQGVRVAQAQIYGYGMPILMPIGMIQAAVTETIARLDLDGSGARDFLPVPALLAVMLGTYSYGSSNVKQSCAVYLLPASDD